MPQQPHPVLDALIGEANECVAYLNGHPCLALLDTGSQVTSISEQFYREHLSDQPMQPLKRLVRVVGAAGQEVPFLGYVELSIVSSISIFYSFYCFQFGLRGC